jgi:hypothetical protein
MGLISLIPAADAGFRQTCCFIGGIARMERKALTAWCDHEAESGPNRPRWGSRSLLFAGREAYIRIVKPTGIPS